MQTIKDLNVNHKKVFLRVDFNVPLEDDGSISDPTRIEASLPTLKHLLNNEASVIIASHLGRPKGEKNPKYSLKAVAAYLSTKIQKPIIFWDKGIDSELSELVKHLKPGNIILLENIRFYPEEEKNNLDFAKKLAQLADIYVNDAFGTLHRAHASTSGICKFLEIKAAGFLVEKEIENLSRLKNPEEPFVLILGGAKVSDKIGLIEAFLDIAHTIIIGGAMAYTFLKALNIPIGKTKVDLEKIDLCLNILQKAKEKNVNILLPEDHIISTSFDPKTHKLSHTQTLEIIPEDALALDIGPKTCQKFSQAIEKAKTIFWNGPMGVFEIPLLAQGTFSIAKSVAKSQALSIVGGGDSVKALDLSQQKDKISFISTGGGASLEFLEGKLLPGIASLNNTYAKS